MTVMRFSGRPAAGRSQAPAARQYGPRMTALELARAYLHALPDADLPAMLWLFTPAAIVPSPLYGQTTPAAFYPRCSRTPARLG